MATIGDLVVRMGLDRRPFETGLTKVQSQLGTLGGKFASFAGIGGIGGALAGMFSVGSFGNMIAEQFELIDSTQNLADSLGITGNSLVGFQYAAKMSGIETETLTNALRKAQLLKPGQSFLELASSISSIEDPAARARAAVDSFGKSGQQLLPMFAGGLDSLKAFISEGQRLKGFTPADSTAVGEAGDAIDKMKASVTGLSQVIAVELSPLIKDMANEIQQMVPKSDKATESFAAWKSVLTDFGKFNEIAKFGMGFTSMSNGLTALNTLVSGGSLQDMGKNMTFFGQRVGGAKDEVDSLLNSTEALKEKLKPPMEIIEQFSAKAFERVSGLREEMEMLQAPEGMRELIQQRQELDRMFDDGASYEQLAELQDMFLLRNKILSSQKLANDEQQRMNELTGSLHGRLEALRSPFQIFSESIVQFQEGLSKGLIDMDKFNMLKNSAAEQFLKDKNGDPNSKSMPTGGGPSAFRVGTSEALSGIVKAGLAQSEAKAQLSESKRQTELHKQQLHKLNEIARDIGKGLTIEEVGFDWQ